jgi:hypothetical protein
MIWSWMKRCGIPMVVANHSGFVAHGKVFSIRYIDECNPDTRLHLRSVVKIFEASDFPHSFHIEPSLEAIKQTWILLQSLKSGDVKFDRWTAVVARVQMQPFPEGSGLETFVPDIRERAFFAFTNEADAVRARLTL